MSEGTPSSSVVNKKQLRKRALLLLTLVFSLVIAGYLLYWFLVSSHYVSTDNAYVQGNQVQVMAQVSGSVTQVSVDNTDKVNAGDLLIALDPTDAKQAYERARTNLAENVRQTQQLMVTGQELQANIELKQTELQRLQDDLKRREALASSQAIGREELQHARDAVRTAQASLQVAIKQHKANQAILLDTPITQQPAVRESASQVRDAWLALQRTQILSPVKGYVSRRNVQPGSHIAPGKPLMAIIPADELWVNANFKETQLGDVRIGQRATLVSDFYGSRVIYHGTVAGLEMGTGSAFSLLPAQNATGNWIKVVQRLPVRIILNKEELQRYPLRIGLSMQVSIDTRNRQGSTLATESRQQPAYSSSALTLDLTPVNQVIQSIIQANTQ
ncbi:MAG: multidrug efflux MFS transporter periplasmic adaptor subunit EmrA [Enterobacteriaceae bacterium]